jgi:hypothetical protein
MHSSSSARLATPRIARMRRVAFRESSLSLKLIFVEDNFLLGAPTELGTCRACVCMFAAVFYAWQYSQRLRSRLYQETHQIWNKRVTSVCLSQKKVHFAVPSSSLPHPDDCVHGRPGEQASEAPSVEILHREMGDKVFGERLGTTARLRLSSPICVLFVWLGDIDPSPWATTMVELLLRFWSSRSPRTCF